MNDLACMEIFFVGTHALTSSLPISEVDEEVGKFKGVDFPGFQVVDTFDCLKELQYPGELTFTCAQALVVTPVEYGDVRHWERSYSDFRGYVFVTQRAVDWLLCFPVDQRQDGQYVPWTRILPPDDDDVFFYLSSAARAGTPIQGGAGTPAGGIGSLDAAHHGGTRRAAPEAGSPEPEMAELWAALERPLRCLESANATVERLYTTVHRFVATLPPKE